MTGHPSSMPNFVSLTNARCSSVVAGVMRSTLLFGNRHFFAIGLQTGRKSEFRNAGHQRDPSSQAGSKKAGRWVPSLTSAMSR